MELTLLKYSARSVRMSVENNDSYTNEMRLKAKREWLEDIQFSGTIMTACKQCGTFTNEGQVCVECTNSNTFQLSNT